jgi:hypothetical protein
MVCNLEQREDSQIENTVEIFSQIKNTKFILAVYTQW